jgi:hypothetical protein
MVEFVTLFLGALIAGPTDVAFQVHQDVAAVEIRLDTRAVATLREAPWELEVDFGEELAPHLVEAIAYTGHGREIGRARQWVNLAPRQTDVTITLDRSRSDNKVEARLSWQSLSHDNEPIAARAVFDGQVLEVGDPRIIALPSHDPDRLHHLRVELEFPGGLQTTAEATFGGVYGDSVSSELTAFPVSITGVRELPPVEEMQGWFRSGIRPVRVHAAEKGLAEIVIVRSPPAKRHLSDLLTQRERRPTFPVLRKDHRLRFVGVAPALVTRDGSSFVVFPRSEEIGTRVGGLVTTLGSVSFPVGSSAEERLADAVAVAGLLANQSARRRAVVLITTDESHDSASQFTPEQVRRYLERIGVPIVVWNPEVGKTEAARWGPALNISTDSLLDNAYRELRRLLDRQRIVWLNGSYLPQTVVIDHDVARVRRAR